MKVSVIINTSNRGTLLRRCLFSLQRQTFSDFEVVVVAGPSTDDTNTVCSLYDGKIKLSTCEDLNLSLSRNIGIANSAGEICAFIDDDAVAHPRWLECLLRGYAHPTVVGVGGFTYDHSFARFQSQAVVCDRTGEAESLLYPETITSLCDGDRKHSHYYPSLLGTNSSFRRQALLEINGFDEVFAYFLDETDVCLRLYENGGDIVTIPDAIVYHGYAQSHMRTANNVPKTRYFPVRSKAYFIKKHASKLFDSGTLNRFIAQFIVSTKNYNRGYFTYGHLSRHAADQLDHDTDSGFLDAIKEFALYKEHGQTSLLSRSQQRPAQSFCKFPSSRPKLNIAFISRGFPPDNNQGIARWVHTLATELNTSDHNVHVITQQIESLPSQTDYECGLWIHRVHPNSALPEVLAGLPFDQVPRSLLAWSAAAYSHLLRTRGLDVDVISAPIWDLEGIVPLLLSKKPVVTSLHTTYGMALPYKTDWTQNEDYLKSRVKPVIRAEEFVLKSSQYLLANSHAIVRDLQELHGLELHTKSRVVPHGIQPAEGFEEMVKQSHACKILFVGRQESRKGFDAAISAAILVCAQHPTVEFVFVGQPTGDAVCEAALHELNSSLHSLRISVVGHVPADTLDSHYKSCDIFICPSRYESFGLIAIEAMRYGKAVIASNRGGLAEVVIDGYTGLCVDPDSPQALANAIMRLCNDPALRSRLGMAALDSVHKRFSSSTMAQQISHYYSDIIANHSY